MTQLYVPKATDYFKKMSEVTDLFIAISICAGRFFSREMQCGFWQKK
ncbi:hypothetical protein HMPREF9069_00668 [Atopobium sp. oral taxon 810 str. F0209]|nr:hypothetical protein HMPREF9069_00668 [Atopobium sp. oral taxon 810 str. F0209]